MRRVATRRPRAVNLVSAVDASSGVGNETADGWMGSRDKIDRYGMNVRWMLRTLNMNAFVKAYRKITGAL